ncbi:hypothetical protein LCL97_05010 [Seohaeicola saemankumensis]|nr:hypothetical protein [Seohaeicola saemankumensis]MCA0870169.1 hypothetical protein [Seohaeicola saemankumensis]
MKTFLILTCCLLAGCGVFRKDRATDAVDATPLIGASAAEEDTPPAEVVEAAAVPDETPAAQPAIGGPLRTIAGLGDPGQPGLWLRTPLVTSEGAGKVVLAATGASAQVTLIPADGPATGGSQLSLQGFQALGAPLTELIELDVYPGG